MTAVPAKIRPGSGPFPGHRLACAILLLAVCLVYREGLDGPFVYDDVPAILENPTLRHPAGLADVLAPPGDQAGTVGGRPLLNVSLALNFAIGGTSVTGYHVFNLGVHAAAALLLYGVVRRSLVPTGGLPGATDGSPLANCRSGASPSSDQASRGVAFLAALLWAVHPLATAAVTYVVQRAESMMGLFYLATLYCFIRSTETRASGRSLWTGLAVAACFCGMATKEVMVSAPLMVLLYDRMWVSGSWREAWSRRRGLYLGLAASWLLLAVLVASTHGRGGSAGFATSAGVGPYALTQARAIVHYLRLAFWPDRLVFDYGTALVRHPGDVWWPCLLLLFLLAATRVAWRRRPAVGMLALWFFVLLAPSSSLVPIATEPIAEHRMYLPLAAVSILAVAGLWAALNRGWPRRAPIMLAVLGLAGAVGLGLATIRRNRDYRSELALWTDTVAKVPGNPRARNNLAEAYRARGETARAAAEFAAAVQVDPEYAPAQYNLGVTLLDSGQPAAAIPHLEKALAAPRHQAELQLFLGEALTRTEQFATAAEHFRAAWQLAPGNVEAVFGLGNDLAALGRYAEAAKVLRQAVALAPEQVRVRNNLANALLFSGQLEAAITEYRESLRREPENDAVRQNLARALELRAVR